MVLEDESNESLQTRCIREDPLGLVNYINVTIAVFYQLQYGTIKGMKPVATVTSLSYEILYYLRIHLCCGASVVIKLSIQKAQHPMYSVLFLYKTKQYVLIFR